MLLSDIVQTSQAIAATASRKSKTELLAACLARLAPDEVEIGIACLTGEVLGGKIGVGGALVHDALARTSAGTGGGLALAEVQRELEAIRTLAGPGSTTARGQRLAALFARADEGERDFLARWIVGELRQGALEGVMEDALARAANLPVAAVRRAVLLTGDLVRVGALALTRGAPALAALEIELFRPLQPMLAGTADGAADVLEQHGRAAFEHKLDGARVQVHRSGDAVRVFSRLRNDVTHACPELVEVVRALPAHELVLDGEAIALRPNGRAHPFQVTMRRFGRKVEADSAARAELPLSTFFFDVLRIDGTTLVDEPAERRFAVLGEAVPARLVVPRLVTADVGEAERFLADALERGQEGLVAKALDAPYEAGRRGKAWLKLKPAHTLDLVVLAAEWGNGRREGFLSNLHLGARDPERGGFVMLGKTFKGLTDELLAWQTKELLAREIAREGHAVHVRPELVVEIAFDELQASRRYPGGLALRFARVKRYRTDKRAEEADTIERVRALAASG